MAAKFEIYTEAKGEYRFRLKAGNGEVVAAGESYPTDAGVRKGIEAVKRAAAEATITGPLPAPPSRHSRCDGGFSALTGTRPARAWCWIRAGAGP